MNTTKIINLSSKFFVWFCVLSLGYVSLLSLISPQSTMDLVNTTLPNTDALSSIRGIYGGVGLIITINIVILLFSDLKKSLVFLSIFWGVYAICRVITILADGPLGDFGTQWLILESLFSVLALTLLTLNKKHVAIA